MRALHQAARGLRLLAAMLALASCGSSSGGRPGDGGFAGSGGSATGSDGSLGGPPGDCELLPCFVSYQAAVSPCAGAGACTRQGSNVGVGSVVHYCFANGVKEHLTIQNGSMATARLTRTDGLTTCYSVDIYAGPPRPNDSLGFSYRDASGTLIGTADTHPDGSFTMTCGGVSKTLTKACLDQMNAMMPSTTTAACVDGVCQ
jgi:hypothetical protein